MEKGFKDSAFRLNDFVKNCDQWTETEMKQRQQNLFACDKETMANANKQFSCYKARSGNCIS